MLVSRLLFVIVFGFESGCPGLENWAFYWRSIFHDFGWPWDQFWCGSWHFWYPNLLFGMLGGFTLASWGTLGRSWDTGEHKKGQFEVQAWFLLIFGASGDPIWKLFGYLGPENVHFVMHVSRLLFLMVFGFESGCKTKHFAREVLQKSTLQKLEFSWFQGRFFHDFGWRWDEFSCLLLPWRLACK